jgi:hypothetical protein
MKLSKQDQKYQATQQLTAKFAPQCNNVHGFYMEKVDITQLLKKVVK